MEFKIADPELAEQGRKRITLAENEMPGLMELRRRYADDTPLDGVNVTGSLHMTVETAVLIETLTALGANVRWASCNIYSTEDDAAAAVVDNGVSVFAWEDMTVEEYWWCTEQALDFDDGPDLIVDDGGDATLMVHRGVEAERDPSVFDTSFDGDEAALMRRLRDVYEDDSHRWRSVAETVEGVSEETTTGVNRLYTRAEDDTLLFPAINVNDSVTKSKFDNLYGCRESLIDGLKRATDVMIAGKSALVIGYGDVGKGCVQSLDAYGADVHVAEVDPICALQAAMEGYDVVEVTDVIDQVDIVVTATGNTDVVTWDDMQQLSDGAILCNIGHFDNEIDVEALRSNAVEHASVRDHVDKYTLPSGSDVLLLADGRLVNLGCATGHPSFVMSASFCNQVLAQIELWQSDYDVGVHTLPKRLDEEVARLHLDAVGADLTELSDDQARYIDVDRDGPFKPDHYRY